jgi:hypothetical protein
VHANIQLERARFYYTCLNRVGLVVKVFALNKMRGFAFNRRQSRANCVAQWYNNCVQFKPIQLQLYGPYRNLRLRRGRESLSRWTYTNVCVFFMNNVDAF